MNEPPSRFAALIDELKRRRVFNVAAVYLVGMWVVIQVADLTFTRLGLPDWTVTFVIVLGGLMFPVVVALAWAFDLTRSGITRTAPRAARPEATGEGSSDGSPHSAPVGSEPAGAAHPNQRGLVLFLAALVTLGLIGFGLWWTGVRGARGADLDDALVAVTPFRLAGADEELDYLREGLMDLIAARIGGASGELDVVPPRNVSRRIKETLGSLDADPDRDEALAIAGGFGAGLLLEGDIVGTAESFTVTARLYDVRTGYRLHGAELEAHPDSLHDLVDRIAARLVAAESGLREDRLAALTTASMPALRSFLEGEQAFRRGDHDRAVRGYDRAVTLDSTFALAALGLLRAQGWAIGLSSENADRAEAIVRRDLDRLSEADRLYFEAYVGDAGPEPYRDLVDRRVQAAQRMPHMPELQFLAGDGIIHYGEAVGVPDAFERARRYFERTIEMDSTYIEPLSHLYDLASLRGDTAELRRMGDLLLAVDSTGPMATAVRYTRQRDPTRPSPHPPIALDTLDFQHLGAAATVGWFDAPDPEIAATLHDRLDRATTTQERVRLAGAAYFLAIMSGQPSRLEPATRALADGGYQEDIGRLVQALYWLRDLHAALNASPDVRDRLADARRQATPDAPLPYAVTSRECILGHLRVAERDHQRALAHADSLERAVRPGRDPWWNSYDGICARFLKTAAAVQQGDPDALERMEALHEDLGAGTPRPPSLYALYDLASADLWEELGQPERALEAARRRVHLPVHGIWHVELDGATARLAEQLGHRDLAVRAYSRYLAWREDGEGVFAERADRARQALQRLVGEG